MGNSIGKGRFIENGESKKIEKIKGKETVNAFDPVKNAAQADKKKRIIETSKPAVNDQFQHSDVGSSSDSSKIRDIPAKFEYIGGNTDLANAKVILLGEAHVLQHYKDIVDFINTHAADSDLVLGEGLDTNVKMDGMDFAWASAVRLGVVGKDLKMKFKTIEDFKAIRMQLLEKEGILFTKNLDVCGCDDISANKQQHKVIAKKEEILRDMRLAKEVKKEDELYEEFNKLERLYRALSAKREEKMIETINEMRKDFSDKRIFIIVGKNHALNLLGKIKNQEYIALSPNYIPSEGEEEAFDMRLRDKSKQILLRELSTD